MCKEWMGKGTYICPVLQAIFVSHNTGFGLVNLFNFNNIVVFYIDSKTKDV